MFLNKIIRIIFRYWQRRSGKAYINYLRKKGVSIGSGCIVRDVLSIRIDITHPSLVTIGDNVDMNKDFELLTHDWGSHVFVRKYNDFIPHHKRVEIGNNVYFGTKCVVLAGAKIGDNCVIGACSLVNGGIPANSVAAGIPAKVICSIDEYYEKRKSEYIGEGIDLARSIQERFNRSPVLADFYDDYPLFVDGSTFNVSIPSLYYNRIFNKEQLEIWKKEHKAPFKDFDDFLQKSGIK
ncbi:MAG: acyltransferase [Bacteroidales bacterium]|jgi:acetyltransferase-like isoleucine patch superfamily enzyme|nr:acyltransferase [Bacteroidales bacterium]